MKILFAKYVLPISELPIENGAIAIKNDKIIAVGKKEELTEKYPDAANEDLGNSVIMPGFVNCHSHLELTVMRGFLDEFDEDFASWLLKLTKTRRDILTDEDIEISSTFGALEGVHSGVTCFGDIGRWGRAGLKALKENGLRGVLFQETEFSPDNKTSAEDFSKLEEKFLELKQSETELVKVGISPHSPYTVSQKLFESIADYTISNNIKTTIHASESLQERSLMRDGTGFFADIYEEKNVNWESPRSSTIEYLSTIGVLESKPLLAHCVQVSESDIELIKQSDSSIAHCPKSNAKFGHGIAPFEKFLDKQIPIGFGTDSMVSNNACDIIEEARFATMLARIHQNKQRFIHAKEVIETATIGGARALGLENKIGTLEAGKQADLIVITLETVAQMPVHNIYNTLLFASNASNVRLTMVAGKITLQDGVSTKVDELRLKTKIEEIKQKMS